MGLNFQDMISGLWISFDVPNAKVIEENLMDQRQTHGWVAWLGCLAGCCLLGWSDLF